MGTEAWQRIRGLLVLEDEAAGCFSSTPSISVAFYSLSVLPPSWLCSTAMRMASETISVGAVKHLPLLSGSWIDVDSYLGSITSGCLSS